MFSLALGDVAELRGDLWDSFSWNSGCRKHQGVQQVCREAGHQMCRVHRRFKARRQHKHTGCLCFARLVGFILFASLFSGTKDWPSSLEAVAMMFPVEF